MKNKYFLKVSFCSFFSLVLSDAFARLLMLCYYKVFRDDGKTLDRIKDCCNYVNNGRGNLKSWNGLC